ncbi:exodeoxyribonuclease V subunit alpha [Stenotrophomonas humi]|uniref:RecBCD enzyme subunit RecD n=1 Tax=Stenotrophomonas humi TaxID=405444 RepID=A0A0R0BWL6_9GAMM|nr:exodeoxyribonuclease V subunit alpha [Stenotrophomonas humi]KRG61951.1 exodeoxyribonuclease V subunit alpha [Stenotrophomonas humi]
MSLLAALNKAGALRALDHAFAQSLRRLDVATPDEVLTAAALASLAVSQGHAGFDPAQPQRLVDAGLTWPIPEEWKAQLAASRWISTAVDNTVESEQSPLVWENGLLYLRRYREYERRLALGLQRIGQASVEDGDVAGLAGVFARLFPGQGASVVQQADLFDAPSPQPSPERGGGSRRAANLDSFLVPPGEGARRAGEGRALDHQAHAAAVALRHNLLLVTGGPGTGKTTTITRLLVLLAAQAQAEGRPAPRVALAAPTGRAAERMAESLRNAVQQLPATGIDAALCEQLPSTGTTLHRLLGVIPDSPRFRHHADNPLPYDVVVVDEASMIDLPLMTKLVEAIAEGTRLVLLGDPDQLPSVEAGDVLSAILRAAGDGQRIAVDDARVLQPLLGALPAAAIQTQPNPFAGARVQLQRGYRQSEALQLAPLANAMRQGDAAETLALLREGNLSGVQFHEDEVDPLQAWREPLQQYWEALATAASPAEALALAGRTRLLTAVREGPQGARGLNARIEELLAGTTRRGTGPGYFHGRLLIITENSYRHRLFNGDIGICLRSEASPFSGSEGGSRGTTAWFPGDEPTTPRAFHPAALPAHESAFAMTVHKAQGSEFDQVWLQLPRRDNRVLSRELLYTGITRARHGLHIAGSAEVIGAALARHASRWSGLAQRLLVER